MRRRARKMSRLGCIYFVVLLGALIGGSLWLDRRGDTARAVVTGKHEEIRVQQTPRDEWARWYRIGVEFPTPDGGLGMATVTVPQERYDALRRGDSLDVHYLPAFPLLARAADRSTAQVLWDIGHGLLGNRFLLAMLMWLGAGFVALWIAARVATPLVFVVGLAWTALAVPLLFPAPTPAFPAPAAATARVEAITLVTKSPARTRRPPPSRGPESGGCDAPPGPALSGRHPPSHSPRLRGFGDGGRCRGFRQRARRARRRHRPDTARPSCPAQRSPG